VMALVDAVHEISESKYRLSQQKQNT
jgi:hypothetical protein